MFINFLLFCRPRILTQNGHLMFQTGINHNITFQSSNGGYINVDGHNLNAVVQIVSTYHTIPYRTIPYHTIPYHTIPLYTLYAQWSTLLEHLWSNVCSKFHEIGYFKANFVKSRYESFLPDISWKKHKRGIYSPPPPNVLAPFYANFCLNQSIC